MFHGDLQSVSVMGQNIIYLFICSTLCSGIISLNLRTLSSSSSIWGFFFATVGFYSIRRVVGIDHVHDLFLRQSSQYSRPPLFFRPKALRELEVT